MCSLISRVIQLPLKSLAFQDLLYFGLYTLHSYLSARPVRFKTFWKMDGFTVLHSHFCRIHCCFVLRLPLEIPPVNSQGWMKHWKERSKLKCAQTKEVAALKHAKMNCLYCNELWLLCVLVFVLKLPKKTGEVAQPLRKSACCSSRWPEFLSKKAHPVSHNHLKLQLHGIVWAQWALHTHARIQHTNIHSRK